MKFFINLSAYLTLSISLVAIIGDYLVSVIDIPLLKALCDNITHAFIGAICWGICYTNQTPSETVSRKNVLEILGCFAISSFIDLDHFLAAKSVSLKDATKLKHRPWLHCSTIPLLLFASLMLVSYILECSLMKRWALIMLTAFSTHHIRDATRRGLWFYPYGSTAPIPYVFYIALTCAIPHVVIVLDRVLKIEASSDSSHYSSVI